MGILRFILFIIHLFLMALLCIMLLNGILPASVTPYTNLLSLAFPFLMGAHLLLCLFWIFSCKKRSFLFLFLTIFLFNATRRWVNYNPKKLEGSLKVLTLNCKGGKFGEQQLHKYLAAHADYDLILLQESLSTPVNNSAEFGIGKLFTKHPIIHKEKILTDDTENGNAFYADVDIDGKTIRAVNVYLEPFQFEKTMVKPTKDAKVNEEKAKNVIKKLLPAYRIHREQADKIRKVIDDSPYPVIVAGDFNSVPNSYEYYRISEKLSDAFEQVGRGSGTSFHDYKFPIRIDYIFSTPEIKPTTYRVDRSRKLSDHYPVEATFNFK